MLDLGEQVAQVGVHVQRQRVELVGPLERDCCHAVVDGEVEVLPLLCPASGRPERHCCTPPPSRIRDWPFTAAASSEAKYATAAATSSTWTRRPSGCICSNALRASSAERPVVSTMRCTLRSVISV